MNNKGFTLIEVLGVLVVASILLTITFRSIHSTLSVSKEEAYKLMKNNIISASYEYIQECNQKLISCDFSFENNNQFVAEVLKESGYLKNLNSPIDGKDLGSCLLLEATNSNGVTVVNLIDDCY
ncbi:MAG: prepilin-type N-terminal cleavage/methylation domain-containing protein [Erysipelotrichaceae bacterium]|nr:prepilin-type N-terminal cleavage/methylation domain-containing protein [Erysipelotrichaceae bacterium]